MKSNRYIVEITTQKLFQLLVILTNLLVSSQLGKFPSEFTEKCFAIFDQSSRTTYLTWY